MWHHVDLVWTDISEEHIRARGFFCPEDGGDTSIGNIGSHKIYMVPHSRKWHSLMKSTVFWNVALCTLVEDCLCSGGMWVTSTRLQLGHIPEYSGVYSHQLWYPQIQHYSQLIPPFNAYCDVFPVNTSNNLRILDFMLDLLVMRQAELQSIITIAVSL
jgi:hypothetical protein